MTEAFQKGRKVSKEQRQTIQLDTATYLSNLELYDCTNIDILNLNQTATLFADSYLVANRCFWGLELVKGIGGKIF